MRDSDIVTRTSLAKESKKLDVASENTTCMGSCVVLCQVMKEARRGIHFSRGAFFNMIVFVI